MAFNPLSLLILRFRGRSVAVIRHRCGRYEVSRPCHCLSPFVHEFHRAAGTGHPTGRTAQLSNPTGRSHDDIIILASIPGYSDSLVEISTEIWSMINEVVPSVTIALQSGAPSVTLR